MSKEFFEFLEKADFSLLEQLNIDPEADINGNNCVQREVLSGHYVPVIPKPLTNPKYIAHSKILFDELEISQRLIKDKRFCSLFSGDISFASEPMKTYGWATGYALSIYGTEFINQCPFGTGNGYGDGRAISIFEGIFKDKRWEMQLKGAGPTPYCRGADGRAVLRSSVREFLAQEFMYALGVPTSRSLTLFVSSSEKVKRPWYSRNSKFLEPDVMLETPAAISTRAAPSFLRVGQFELFARRLRSNSHNQSYDELQKIVNHLIFRNYKSNINKSDKFTLQLVELVKHFQNRLSSLVANWIRVGYCQGNFNSDNCAAGGYTLDYGPFGFCELFEPNFQPWIGGGKHFSFLNQPIAAEINFRMFCNSIKPLLLNDAKALEQFDHVADSFSSTMSKKLQLMWARKLGIKEYDHYLVEELLSLMYISKADYTVFFRRLSEIPDEITSLKDSFYSTTSQEIDTKWLKWFSSWRKLINLNGDIKINSNKMKLTNPKYTWREWIVASAYEKAESGNFTEIYELLDILSQPYEELSSEIQDKYDKLRPHDYFNKGGITHYSCSS